MQEKVDAVPAPVTLAVVGVFRSGTNYLRTLIEINYRAQVVYNAYGWKHGFVPIVTNDYPLACPRLPTLVITRNPFSAVDALFRYVNSTGANIRCDNHWHEFLRKRLVIHNKWDLDSPQLWFPNPVHYWTAMNWNYLSAAGRANSVCHVRYEDLISDPQAETQRIANKFNLEPLTPAHGFVNAEKRTKNMNDQERVGMQQYMTERRFDKRAFYLSHAYMNRFAKEDRDFVREQLDDELLEQTGYAALVRELMESRPVLE